LRVNSVIGLRESGEAYDLEKNNDVKRLHNCCVGIFLCVERLRYCDIKPMFEPLVEIVHLWQWIFF
jgi:hypothetical protein